MEAARRRLATLREQLTGGKAAAESGGNNRGGAAEASTTFVVPAHVSSSSSSAPGPASSSYARIHGPVSTAPVDWVPCSPKSPGSGLLLLSSSSSSSSSSGPEGEKLRGEGAVRLSEVLYHKGDSGTIARIAIDRPQSRNAFTPRTVAELSCCLADARDDPRVGAVILTGSGEEAFCSGGDQRVRSDEGGYKGEDGVPRLSVLDLQVQIRRLPKPVIALVKGYAVGGGHVLQVCCDLCVAADNAVFGQTGPKVGSFDAGYGCSALSRIVGQRKAREIWLLARLYDAREAQEMGLVNVVVPLAKADDEAVSWARQVNRNSPTALRLLKSALNAVDDGAAGLQQLGGDATLLFYRSEEGSEGRRAFVERRRPDFGRFGRLP